jgi:hypothetical protein
MGGGIVKFLSGRLLDNSASVHHTNPVAYLTDNAEIMGDKHQCHPCVASKLYKQV